MENQYQKAARWPQAHLFAFRFAFVYLVLYTLPFPLGSIPYTESLAKQYRSVWHHVVPWFAKHVLHFSHEISYSPYVGDTLFDYAQVLCFLVLALAFVIVWYSFDRSRANHIRLQRWLLLYVRLSVGTALISYGAAKIFQQQFHQPNLYDLLRPSGESSLMDLLWTFMGASQGYCTFAGCVEILGGILLFVPRLVTLGALIGIAALSNIFALNVFYGVWVKLYSFHLLLMCIILVLPQTRRFLDFFVLNRNAEPAAGTALFGRKRLNTIAMVLQLTLCAFLVCYDLYQARDSEEQNSSVASRPPFYGIWIVDEFMLDGKALPPLLTDELRWQRMIFQYPKGVGIQSMNGSWTGYWLSREMEKKTFDMETPGEPKKRFALTFSNLDSQSLILEGNGGEYQIRVKLHRVDEKQFPLLDQDIHWIHEDTDN